MAVAFGCVVADLAGRIAAAAGDPGALLALAIELSNENARLEHAVESLVQADADRRAKQARRTRRSRGQEPAPPEHPCVPSRDDTLRNVTQRDVTLRDVTQRDVTPPPTPIIGKGFIGTPTAAAASAGAREAEEHPNGNGNGTHGPTVSLLTLESEAEAAVFDPILALLDRIPASRRKAWQDEIRVAKQGMHGPAMTRAQIDEACRDYLGNGNLDNPSMRHFRAYLRDATRPPAEHAPALRSDRTRDRGAEAAWLEISALMPAWHRREVTVEVYGALPGRHRKAMSAIGGFSSLAAVDAKGMSFLKRDFIAAFRAAGPDP